VGINAPTRLSGSVTPATKSTGSIRPQNVQPNIVFIMFDDGGAEKFRMCGLVADALDYALTPRINEMRGYGVTFQRAYAYPICSPSRYCADSGMYGFRTGCGWVIEPTDTFSGDPNQKLIARAMRLGRNATDDLALTENVHGYSYGWFGKDHMAPDSGYTTNAVNRKWGRYVGMQPNAGALPADGSAGHYHFTEIFATFGATPTTTTYGNAGDWPAGGPYVYHQAGTPQGYWDGYKVWSDAVQWINGRTKPFIAKICWNPPHAPFEVPPYTYVDDVGSGATGATLNMISSLTQTEMTALDGGGKSPGYRPTDLTSIAKVYRANVEAIDTLVGALWDRMSVAKRDNTVFIFWGDNGTVGQAVQSPYNAGRAKRTPYEMGARVPCLIWGPPAFVTGNKPNPNYRVSSHLVHIVDVFPTILELCGANPDLWNPGGAQKIDGRSLARILRDPDAPAVHDGIYTELFDPLGATFNGTIPIQQNRWVKAYRDAEYLLVELASGVTPRHELYRIDGTIMNGPGQSGLRGYVCDPLDNLYPLVNTTGNDAITARFNTLLAAMQGVVNS